MSGEDDNLLAAVAAATEGAEAPVPEPTAAPNESAQSEDDNDAAEENNEEASPEADEDVTEEGRTATELDPELRFRFELAFRRATKEKKYEEAVELLTELLPECASRYGQLCPLLANMYYTYGHALLRIAESKVDALGGPGEEEEEESGKGEKAADAGEEEITEEEAEDADDVQVAFENLDVARVIYCRMEPTKETEVALAKTYVRLGDAESENERFAGALEEYKQALLLFTKHLPPHDRWLADVLANIGTTYIQLANSKTTTEGERRAHLMQVVVSYQAACEALALLVRHVAAQAGNVPLVSALDVQLGAGALKRAYGPGTHTTALGGDAAQGAGAGAGAGASSSSLSSSSPVAAGEAEIRVFRTLAATFWTKVESEQAESEQPSSSSSSSSSSSAPPEAHDELPEVCEIIDSLLTRMSDIQAELGVSVSGIISQVAAAGSQSLGGGVTTSDEAGAGAGASSSSSATFESSSSTSSGFTEPSRNAAPAATLQARRKAPAPPSSSSSAAAADGAVVTDSVAGTKRPREEEEEAPMDASAAKEARTE